MQIMRRKDVGLLVLAGMSSAFAGRAVGWHLWAWQPGPKAAVTTASGVCVLCGALLLGWRFAGSRSSTDLYLALGLGLLGMFSLMFGMIAVALPDRLAASPGLHIWRTAGRLLVVGVLTAAVWQPARTVDHVPRGAVAIGALGVGAAAFIMAFPALSGSAPAVELLVDWPEAVSATTFAAVSMLAGFAMLAGLLLTAEGCMRLAGRTQDGMSQWLALGCTFFLVGVTHQMIDGAPGLEWLHTSDLFWLVGAIMVLAGCGHALWEDGQSRASEAALEDRLRVASELHDGLAQELALLSTQARRLARRGADPEACELLEDASARALVESRRAIRHLRRGAAEQPSGGRLRSPLR